MLPSSVVSISVELLFYENPYVSVSIRTELILSLLSHMSQPRTAPSGDSDRSLSVLLDLLMPKLGIAKHSRSEP